MLFKESLEKPKGGPLLSPAVIRTIPFLKLQPQGKPLLKFSSFQRMPDSFVCSVYAHIFYVLLLAIILFIPDLDCLFLRVKSLSLYYSTQYFG